MARLDPVKARYIIRQKEAGRNTGETKVCKRWIQKLYAGYRKTGQVPVLGKPERPRVIITDRVRTLVSGCSRRYSSYADK